ncbi:MAG: EAL domain-containing protein [Oceanospirillaceae bacterium]|nr:EAL domain-containing protein [Oceanospirillaceae bacterium]
MIFTPAFQPIKDVDSGSFVAAEVLARWYDEGRVLTPSSLSSPPHWGLVDMEVAWFIHDNLHLCQDRYPILFLNVSEQTLYSGVIFKAWARIIQTIAENHSSRLVIEITEGIQDTSLASRWEALTEIGVELALDDYGDKNSSLERLSRYDWHYCKFDARRLRSLEDYPAILHCRLKGIQLIAEQVESFPLGESAKLLGLSWQQGFYHGKPAVMEKHLNYVKALP